MECQIKYAVLLKPSTHGQDAVLSSSLTVPLSRLSSQAQRVRNATMLFGPPPEARLRWMPLASENSCDCT
eukprot:scaffold197674_cov35-Prasinocladus_malaysianus.AAC.1